MTLNVLIPSYEDLEDEKGHLYTIYNVTIEDHTSGIRWILLKRYSEFADLFKKLKYQYSQLQSFRFPNKSVFNTFSHATKERRRQGFEDFLRITVKHCQNSHDLDEFLGIEDHRRKASSIRKTVAPQPISTERTSVTQINSYDGRNKDEHLDSSEGESKSPEKSLRSSKRNGTFLDVTADSILGVTHSKEDKSISSKIRLEIPYVFSITFVTIFLIYIAAISYGLIDVSNTSRSKIILTILSLVFSFMLIRIIFVQNEIFSKKRVKADQLS